MNTVYKVLTSIIGIIAILIFSAGIVLTLMGLYEMVVVTAKLVDDFTHHTIAATTAVGLLSAVDLFLIAVVFYVFGLGLVMIFSVEHPLAPKLPEWLRIKNFIQLKVLLWEAILTTLVIGFLNTLAKKKIAATELAVNDLIIPIGVFLIALSIFFLKKGEH